MKIETHDGTIAEDATEADVIRVVAGLDDPERDFVVLSDDDHVYVQAAGPFGGEFVVEYRDGHAGEHYRGDRRMERAELVEMMMTYLRQDPTWKTAIEWHHKQVGPPVAANMNN